MFSMPLFKIENNKLNQQKINPFKLEVHIQSLFANNLKEIFNLIFLKEEFVVGDYRLDIMAYDEENNSFVIIEFKRDSKNTAIPQGLFLFTNNAKTIRQILCLNTTIQWIKTCQ